MIRVRIAPSPTGQMHVGTARTALFNWLFAKKSNGVFVLRIEDTDRERSKPEYEESILKGLNWLGLNWDEGPGEKSGIYKGNYGPYRQSERGEIYGKYIKSLLDSGNALWCYHTNADLESEKTEQIEKNEAPRHICSRNSKPLDGGVIRFQNPGGKIMFSDLIRGDIGFDANLMGDFVIAKDEQTPLYNLAAVIDDWEMKISHVIRGEDHISNTPKQILMFDALKIRPPEYAHLPMILGTDRSKLSKRHGATALFEYKDMGYLPEAMFNFLAILGLSPKGNTEILLKEEIIKEFSLKDVQKSGAIFNIDKLNWMNGEYIRGVPIDKLRKLCLPFLISCGYAFQNAEFEWLDKIIALEQPRMKRLSDICEGAALFMRDKLEYDAELLRWRDMGNEEVAESLNSTSNLLADILEENFTKENLEKIVMPKAEAWVGTNGKIDRGRTLWPLRVALSGLKNSPGPFEIMEILGKEKSLRRLREGMIMLE
ncbi:MAG: glutamate--tRNA ligase [Candidatus Spechtbacteria bacterium RIFCSPHIGHO2_02_FULL_43_15b]|uniref:Glutamate--tRNA ligase n=1 Tax=Candidatus Spechtbacteria bacterium RIFCSPHIGHO2_01_FULL_43_30 TaxID=1802158 RepID=A0A1G2H438_9BACT|nr:MAG: glutamate--tRNA ligase [Candidatus Spechtbacteria bacterium RIFCSPHIGHO2_01_FULL_43_30]OGZ58845.1 MAG: glutamate--tRNA ligase [Candidatus Spechtbacteria bacterium RIFCSPHIGHO2_02_FULL_43_15b]